jgi:hypothetical protein
LRPTPRAKHLSKEDKTTDMFEYLLRQIKPRVVLAHGNQAIKFFSRRCAGFTEDIELLSPQTVRLDDLEFQLICSRHLSRTANEKAKKLGLLLAEVLRSA